MINERKLTPAELEKREKVIMKMKGNKRDLVKKYGKDAEAVMYGRATNMAKKKTENMRDSKLTELIKDALKNPKKADLDKDGKLSSYEKTRGKAIEKSMAKEDLESGQYGDPKVGNYDITSQNDNEAGDIEALSAAGLEEAYIGDEKLSDLSKMGTADMNLWHVVKLIDAGILNDSDKLKALKALDPSRELNEDIDIGHEDNEPGMLQGDLYQVGKAAMEIYALLDDMEGEGEVDLPSWWQSKIYKAKEAIVGAAEYLDFELKEPAIDAVVDTVEPLEIEVDPLGETVEDYITGVEDFTENQKVAEKVFNKLKEGLPKGFWDKKIDAKDEDQDGRIDETRDDEVQTMASKLIDAMGTSTTLENLIYAMSTDDAKLYLGAIMQDYDLKEIGGYDRKGNKVDDSDGDAFKKRPQAGMSALLKKDDIDESYDSLVKKIKKSGKSEKAAKAIAGAVASYKAKGGGKGPTAKQK